MVDLEPFLDAPFESASNLSFELLLTSGCVLFAGVAFAGRTTATVVLVSLYLLAIPWYVLMRIHVWDGPDEDADGDGGTDTADGDDANTDGDAADAEPESTATDNQRENERRQSNGLTDGERER